MDANDYLQDDVSDFASRLEAMTSDEVFSAMNLLERHSEDGDQDEILARIALVEEEIERRFPGQKLAPYRYWREGQPLLS